MVGRLSSILISAKSLMIWISANWNVFFVFFDTKKASNDYLIERFRRKEGLYYPLVQWFDIQYITKNTKKWVAKNDPPFSVTKLINFFKYDIKPTFIFEKINIIECGNHISVFIDCKRKRCIYDHVVFYQIRKMISLYHLNYTSKSKIINIRQFFRPLRFLKILRS